MTEQEQKKLVEEVSLKERFPFLVISKFLRERWETEFGTSEGIITERRLPLKPNQEFQNFAYNWHVLGLVIEKGGEWLKKNHLEIYQEFEGRLFTEDERGEVRLNNKASLEDFNLGLKKRYFRN